MAQKACIRCLFGTVMIVAAIAALSAGQQANRTTEQKELLAAEEKDLKDMARRFVTIVIPAADKSFAPLYGAKLPQMYPGSERYSAKFHGLGGWDSDITIDDSGFHFQCTFLEWRSLWPKLWWHLKDGGNMMKPMYKTLQGELNKLLKSGWKRKSKNDRYEISLEDPSISSNTEWTRKDGLSVSLSRTEFYDPHQDYTRRIGKSIKDIDPSLLPALQLSLSVTKRKKS